MQNEVFAPAQEERNFFVFGFYEFLRQRGYKVILRENYAAVRYYDADCGGRLAYLTVIIPRAEEENYLKHCRKPDCLQRQWLDAYLTSQEVQEHPAGITLDTASPSRGVFGLMFDVLDYDETDELFIRIEVCSEHDCRLPKTEDKSGELVIPINELIRCDYMVNWQMTAEHFYTMGYLLRRYRNSLSDITLRFANTIAHSTYNWSKSEKGHQWERVYKLLCKEAHNVIYTSNMFWKFYEVWEEEAPVTDAEIIKAEHKFRARIVRQSLRGIKALFGGANWFSDFGDLPELAASDLDLPWSISDCIKPATAFCKEVLDFDYLMNAGVRCPTRKMHNWRNWL